MKYRKLGNTDIDVSVICLGTMTFGEQNSQQEGFDQMDYAVERGVNFFDTAELYAVMPRKETYGKTEEIVGNWFHERKNRDKIILASKIASKSDGLEWIREGSKSLGFDKKNMNAAIDESLKRLKTDYIDLYQLHWPERKVPKFGILDFEYDASDNDWTTVEEVLYNLDQLVKAGKIRYAGLSNETPWGVMKYLQLSKEKNLPRMMSIQNVYSLVNRVFDIHNSEVSIRENIGLLAYSPLGCGVLSGKYIQKKDEKNSRLNLFKRFVRYSSNQSTEATTKYLNIAQKNNISLTKMALAFVNQQPFVTSNIIGATNLNQLKENIDSIETVLSHETLREIDKVHELIPDPAT